MRTTTPAPTLLACPVVGCTWHRELVLHELDSDGESVFTVEHGPAVAEAARVLGVHADRHAGVHPDDPGAVAPDDDGEVDVTLLEAFTVPEGWAG